MVNGDLEICERKLETVSRHAAVQGSPREIVTTNFGDDGKCHMSVSN